jgi:hypothetical protein
VSGVLRRVFSLVAFLVVVILAVAVFVAAGLGVGWLAVEAGDSKVRWEVAALAFTGFSTLALALATFGLAQPAQRSARVGAEAFSASIRPIIADEPEGKPRTRMSTGNYRAVSLEVRLRNVGTGLAVLEQGRLLSTIPPGATVSATSGALAVPAGDGFPLTVEVEFDDAGQARSYEQSLQSSGFEVEVKYRDMNGDQPSRTTVKATHHAHHGWQHTDVSLFRGDATKPYARLPRET